MSVPQSSFAPAPPLKGRMPNMPLLIFFIFLTRTRELTRKSRKPKAQKTWPAAAGSRAWFLVFLVHVLKSRNKQLDSHIPPPRTITGPSLHRPFGWGRTPNMPLLIFFILFNENMVPCIIPCTQVICFFSFFPPFRPSVVFKFTSKRCWHNDRVTSKLLRRAKQHDVPLACMCLCPSDALQHSICARLQPKMFQFIKSTRYWKILRRMQA